MAKNLFLVEDNDSDVLAIKKAFLKINPGLKIKTFITGDDVIKYFKFSEDDKNFIMPNLIILDYNLIGGSDGIDVLKFLKHIDSKFRVIPIVMLTTSNRMEEIEKAYSNYVNAYITKPCHDFDPVITEINKFFLEFAKNPVGD